MADQLLPRALIAAGPRHITILDHGARVDILLGSEFEPEALCIALRRGITCLARLIGENSTPVADSLTAAALMPADSPPREQLDGAIPLARAIADPDHALSSDSIICTADEAFWPGHDPGLARMAFRIFVSRLPGISRCVAYANLAAGMELCVAGDEPSATVLKAARRILEHVPCPAVVDLRSGLMAGKLTKAKHQWTGRAGRLSITSRSHSEGWEIGPDRTVTFVGGISAFPNLSALPTLRDIEACGTLDYPRSGGVDLAPRLALAKCLAEGSERFCGGNVKVENMRHCPASALNGQWLDPGSIVSYSPSQRLRLGLSPFDATRADWWVKGQGHEGPVWIPAALVFYPFSPVPSWLHASAVSSNGMAAYPALDRARRRAWLELVERDAFQRARFTGPSRPPTRISVTTLPDQPRDLVRFLARRATVQVLLLPSPAGLPVALVRADTPQSACLGMAAGDHLAEVITKAATEVMVQLAHPMERVVQENAVLTPADHAALYNRPDWRCKLDWMLRGPVVDYREAEPDRRGRIGRRACWYDFPSSGPDLHVARVLDPDLIPLTFGYDSDPTGRADVRGLLRLAGLTSEQPLEPHAFA